MDYLIDEKEFIEHEAEIILSGCIQEFLVPKVYKELGKIYWVYPDMKSASLSEYTNNDIHYIKNLTKNYMLRPHNIIFHPNYIFNLDGKWKYHYIPSSRVVLYDSNDLKRYLILDDNKDTDHSDVLEKKRSQTVISDNIPSHILYNKNTGEIEKLLLKHTFIGGRRGKIHIPFDGELKIDNEGNLMLLSGQAYINKNLIELKKYYSLQGGDRIQINQTEFIFW